jgi:tetratricopeptide (TPR) repeat protein
MVSRAKRRVWIGSAVVLFAAVGSAWWFGPALCVGRAEAALVAQEWPAVEAWTARARAWASKDPRVVMWSARVARKLGRYAEMDRCLDEARLLGVPGRRLEVERWLAESESGNIVNLRRELGDLLLKGEDLPAVCEAFARGCVATYRLDDALSVLSTWQADFPEDPQPHFLRGRLLEHRSNLDGAADEFQAALRKAPRHGPAAFNLARIRIGQQKIEEALALYRLAGPSLPDPQPALVGEARCLRELSRLDEARAVVDQALARPKDRLEEAYRLTGERSETALAQAAAERGQIELDADKPEEAERWFARAVEANPHDWRVRHSHAAALRQLGRTKEAAEETERVEATQSALAACDRLIDRLKKQPDDLEARFGVGKMLLEHVSPNQGLVWLNSVLSYEADHVAARELLARYYEDHRAENPEYSMLAELHRRRLAEIAAKR